MKHSSLFYTCITYQILWQLYLSYKYKSFILCWKWQKAINLRKCGCKCERWTSFSTQCQRFSVVKDCQYIAKSTRSKSNKYFLGLVLFLLDNILLHISCLLSYIFSVMCMNAWRNYTTLIVIYFKKYFYV